MKKHLAIIIGVILLLVAFFVIGRQQDEKAAEKSAKPVVTEKATNTNEEFDNKQFSLSEATSIWVIVNKQNQLDPTNYTPTPLVVPKVPLRANITADERLMRSDAAIALGILVAEAKKQDINFNLQSGYRSYDFQSNLYASYVKRQGQATADTQSARPGFSEHQTGLVADLGGTSNPSCDIEECFGTTEEGEWLAANAYKYGFIIRYPKGKQNVVGYIYEPWHIRYVGAQLATEMRKQKSTTLEEFFGLPPAPDYK